MRLDFDEVLDRMILIPESPEEVERLKALYENYNWGGHRSVTFGAIDTGDVKATNSIYVCVGLTAESNILELMSSRASIDADDVRFQVRQRGENKDN